MNPQRVPGLGLKGTQLQLASASERDRSHSGGSLVDLSQCFDRSFWPVVLTDRFDRSKRFDPPFGRGALLAYTSSSSLSLSSLDLSDTRVYEP